MTIAHIPLERAVWANGNDHHHDPANRPPPPPSGQLRHQVKSDGQM
jgi:hypothetical protein